MPLGPGQALVKESQSSSIKGTLVPPVALSGVPGNTLLSKTEEITF